MTDRILPAATPVACDMTGATDTATERIAEYQRLFTSSLVGRERLEDGIRFRFRADPGLEDWVRDLAAREKACCAFFIFEVTRRGPEVLWDASVIGDGVARQVLDEFFRLPETATEGVDSVRARFTDRGLRVMIDESGDAGAARAAAVNDAR